MMLRIWLAILAILVLLLIGARWYAAAARDITRARLAVLIDDLRSPYAEHVYIGHDFTKGDLLRKLQAIKDTA